MAELDPSEDARWRPAGQVVRAGDSPISDSSAEDEEILQTLLAVSDAVPRQVAPPSPPSGSTAGREGAARRADLLAAVSRHHDEIAANLNSREDIPSDCNLSAFMDWIGTVDVTRAAAYLAQCKITDHRSQMSSSFQSIQPQVKLADGSFASMMSTQCVARDCERCDRGAGGYRFQFFGPWTCLAALDPTLNFGSPAGARQVWLDCRTCKACAARAAAHSLRRPGST